MACKSMYSRMGFTLVEVLVTILIFTIGMLGTLVLTTGVVRGNFFSKNVTSATVVAQTTIEGAQRAGYAGADTYVADAAKVPASVFLGGVYFNQTASVVSDAPSARLKTISVVVSWNEANNAARTINLETILAE